MSERAGFTADLERAEHFQFDVSFDQPQGLAIRMDEPAPLGEGAGPNATRMLGAAIGHCLSASLLFCLEKAHVEVAGMTARVEGIVGRNERGRLRVQSMRVVLHPDVGDVPPERLARCIDLFEDFCIVTESVRKGLDVAVSVEPVAVEAAGGAR